MADAMGVELLTEGWKKEKNAEAGILTEEQDLIPTCVLRCHSEMGKKGHRTKKL